MIGTALSVACAGAVAGLTYVTVAPASCFWGPVISRGPARSDQVALTFDDGPTPGSTDRVLDLLGEAKIQAAFFVVGVNARANPGLLMRIHKEGHLVANHTLDHAHFSVLRTLRYWKDQLRTVDEIVESILGVRPAIFRPPMGVKTWHTTRAARELGHTVVTWSRRAVDGFPTTSQRIIGRLFKAGGGEILLLHDGVEPHAPYRDRSATITALPQLIARLREKNLTIARLDELLALPPYQSRAGTAT